MTPLFQDVRDRVKNATPGPWEYDGGDCRVESRSEQEFTSLELELSGVKDNEYANFYQAPVCTVASNHRDLPVGEGSNPIDHWDDAQFIAHSRTDIPKLLEALDVAVEKLEAIKELHIMGDEPLECEWARKALEKIKELGK